jgi:hypothetical protein
MQAFFNEFETDFDARVSVFRGGCSTLECVELDDSFHWDSSAGELYSMLVYGADGSSGNFGLFVDLGIEFCTDVVNPLPTDGETFEGAFIAIGPEISSIDGLPTASSIDGLPLCETYVIEPTSGLTAWFSVVGTGATLTISTCEVSLGAGIAVFPYPIYSGSCGNLTCVEGLRVNLSGYGYVAGDDDDDNYSGYGYGGGYGGGTSCLSASWESVKDEVYYIRSETAATYPGLNRLEYVIRLTESSP